MFRKRDVRPSSGNEAPKVHDLFDRAVPGQWVSIDEMQKKELFESALKRSTVTVLPIWASYLTGFQIHRCSTLRDSWLSPKHAAGILHCQNYYVSICLLYKKNHVTLIA